MGWCCERMGTSLFCSLSGCAMGCWIPPSRRTCQSSSLLLVRHSWNTMRRQWASKAGWIFTNNGLFFPTKLCGVLVFRSVPSASASRLRVLTHTTASHTTLLPTHHLCHTIHTPSLGDIHRRFTWQAWHLATSTFVLRGRRGTYDTWLGLVTRLVPVGRPWRRATLRGRHDTWRHPPPFCVAGVALGDIHLRFAWQGWYLWRLAGSGDALVARDAAPLCVAGMALCDIHRCFTWQAWHLATSTFVLHGRPGSGVALGPRWSPVTPCHFAWQAWHLATSTVVSRGRRGTWRHPPSFCVAGVVLMTLGWVWWRAWSPLVARDAVPLCVAGMTLGDTHLRFAWLACRLATSTFVLRGKGGTCDAWLGLVTCLVPVGRPWRRSTLRGRRGTWRHPPSFHVAGVTLGDIHLRFAWQAWYLHDTWWHPPPFCVAGVALGDIHRHFAWPSFTHNFITHTQLCHTHTHLCHTQICHTPSFTHLFVTHHLSHTPFSHTIFVTHHLSHTTLSHASLSHTFFHTPLCHTPSFTHHFVTHLLSHTTLSHETLSHTVFHTHLLSHTSLSHTSLSHTFFHTPLCHTPSFTHRFVTHLLSHTTLSHTIWHTQLCHTIFHTHTTLSHTLHCVTPNFVLHNFVIQNCSHTTFRSILHHLLCLSFLPRPTWTFCVCLLEEVDLWGYSAL